MKACPEISRPLNSPELHWASSPYIIIIITLTLRQQQRPKSSGRPAVFCSRCSGPAVFQVESGSAPWEGDEKVLGGTESPRQVTEDVILPLLNYCKHILVFPGFWDGGKKKTYLKSVLVYNLLGVLSTCSGSHQVTRMRKSDHTGTAIPR